MKRFVFVKSPERVLVYDIDEQKKLIFYYYMEYSHSFGWRPLDVIIFTPRFLKRKEFEEAINIAKSKGASRGFIVVQIIEDWEKFAKRIEKDYEEYKRKYGDKNIQKLRDYEKLKEVIGEK